MAIHLLRFPSKCSPNFVLGSAPTCHVEEDLPTNMLPHKQANMHDDTEQRLDSYEGGEGELQRLCCGTHGTHGVLSIAVRKSTQAGVQGEQPESCDAWRFRC